MTVGQLIEEELKQFRGPAMANKDLSKPGHPIDALPFEVLYHDSWHGVEHVRVKSGSITVQFEHSGFEIDEKVQARNLRLRSRRASVQDCRCFLRPGTDICAFSATSTEENLEPEYRDAKIISIERKPHIYKCTCQFSVIFYRDEKPEGKRNSSLVRGIKKVTIDNIAVLQKLKHMFFEDGCYHLSSPKDCRSAKKSKLFSRTLAPEISWLFVISIIRGSTFDIRLMQNKIVYLVLNASGEAFDLGSLPSVEDDDQHKHGDKDLLFSCSDGNVKTISFQKSNGYLQPRLETFSPAVPGYMTDPSSIVEMNTVHIISDTELDNEMNDCIALRLAKRQKVGVDNFVSFNHSVKSKYSSTKSATHEMNRWKEKAAVSARQVTCKDDLLHQSYNQASIDMQNEGKEVCWDSSGHSSKFLENQKIGLGKMNVSFDSTQQVNPDLAVGSTHECQLSENHRKVKSTYQRPEDRVLSCEAQSSVDPQKHKKMGHRICCGLIDTGYPACHPSGVEFSFENNHTPGSDNSSSSLPPNTTNDSPKPSLSSLYHNYPVPHQNDTCNEIRKNFLRKISKNSTKNHNQRKTIEEKDIEFPLTHPSNSFNCGYWHEVSSNKQKKKTLHKKLNKERAYSISHHINYYSLSSKRKRCYESATYRQKIFNASDCKQMLERCMKKIENEMEKKHPPVATQWEAKRVGKKSSQAVFDWTSSDDESRGNSDHDELWKEMEISMSTRPRLEADKQSKGFADLTAEGSHTKYSQQCQHEYKLDEEIGLTCCFCNTVSTEIKYFLPPMFQGTDWIRNEHQCNRDNSLYEGKNHLDMVPRINAISSNTIPMTQQDGNVWDLIPDLKTKLHLHQKRAFEFLWKNIAGSLYPRDMEHASAGIGGCVLSHAPGTGKTLLVISFLVSYLILFPRKRPLILAPKTTLYAWLKEFEKWEVSVPVYQMHTSRNYRKEMYSWKESESAGRLRLNLKMMHIMDCLEKLQKWHEHPSVLLMSYSSFFSLLRGGNSKLTHRRYMAEILQSSPGILILDEGHNPRSTRSKLRKALMEVKTDLRILLSGTLFQNNFEEYFNTLCLARPSFSIELAKELYPTMVNNCGKRIREGKNCISKKREKLARKFFVEKIAKRINSGVEDERKQGLVMLREVTNGFIDVHDGRTLNRLPGLQSYTLLMKSTNRQKGFLSKLQGIQEALQHKRYPLELELLITVGSVHPWLIKTVACAPKYFSSDELEELDKFKFHFNEGSKMKFVVNLVQQCIITMEKVLIFCRNIQPINLLVEIFEMVFRWHKGTEVLVLQGDQDLSERARVMDIFADHRGPSRVLVASTTASAEGISLTAASRLVLLDSEWNPSKTKQAIARAFRPGQEKVVYVYQLLASGTFEEEKYKKTTVKEWQSRMIFMGGGCFEDSSYQKIENIDDAVLRELVKEDQTKAFEMILKHEKVGNCMEKNNEATVV